MIVDFICRPSKAGKDGFSPLELSITIEGKRKVMSLGKRIKAKSFNPRTQRVRANPSINEYMEAVRTKLHFIEIEMIKKNLVITIESFVDIFKDGFNSSRISLLSLIQIHIKDLKKKADAGVITSSTVDKYVVTNRYIKNYIKAEYNKDDILLKDITPLFVENFYTYLIDRMTNNTAIQKMKQLKKLLRIAVDENYISTNPFKIVLKKDKVCTIPLTLDEVKAIKEKNITVKRLAKVRDLFLFACYTGLAFTDMANLSKDNIKVDKDGNEWIIKNRQKTNVTSYIPLLPIAKKILVKYDYSLPSFSNCKYNAYLKEIGDICGIRQSLHSHLARHTFATIMLNYGVDMVSVSKMLGHSNSKITENVYATMLPETIMSKVKAIEDKIL